MRLNDPNKPDCNEVCRPIYDEKQEDPPCEKCVPAILPENEDVLRIYLLVQNQVIIAGMEGTVLDINFNALDFILDLYEIPNKRRVFEKVIKLSRYIISEGNKRKK